MMTAHPNSPEPCHDPAAPVATALTSSARFDAVLRGIAHRLAAHGFRRKGTWFSRCSGDGAWLSGINVRKIPQPGSKRTVFQVVSYAGRVPDGGAPAIGSLQAALQHCRFQHHILDGRAERLWTVWPSSDVARIVDAVAGQIEAQSLVALEAHIACAGRCGPVDGPVQGGATTGTPVRGPEKAVGR